MKVYLVKSRSFVLDGYPGHVRRLSVQVEIPKICPFHQGSLEEQELCKRLRKHHQKHMTSQKFNIMLEFNAGAQEPDNIPGDGSGLGFIDFCNGLRKFVAELLDSNVLSVQVELVQLQEENTGRTWQDVRSSAMAIPKNGGWFSTSVTDHQFPGENDRLKAVFMNGGVLEGVLNLVMIVDGEADLASPGSMCEPVMKAEVGKNVMSTVRKILQEELGSDVVIIPGTGNPVKGHTSFLSAHSEVFQAMFRSEMKETQTRRVEMPEMMEKSVRAMLAFLYCYDASEAQGDSGVAFELLSAGHKYDIPPLESEMRNVLLGMNSDCFDLEVAMKLFLFARNLPANGNRLKMKAIEVLKMNLTVLRQSATYLDLFRKNPEAAMELCEYAFGNN